MFLKTGNHSTPLGSHSPPSLVLRAPHLDVNLDACPPEASALSWSQDPRPFTNGAPKTQLLTSFPTHTQPRAHKLEPEAHAPAAAYAEPVIPAKGLGRRPWRLRCLRQELCTQHRCLQQEHRCPEPGLCSQVTLTQPWQPRTSPWSEGGSALVLGGALRLPACTGASVSPQPQCTPLPGDTREVSRQRAFHPAVNDLSSGPRSGQQDSRPGRSLALLSPTGATSDTVTAFLRR